MNSLQRGIWLAGNEVPGRGQVMEIRSPYDRQVVARVATAGEADVADAIESAERAFHEHLRTMPAHRRAAILQKAAQLLEERADELAQILALEGGKPISLARAEARRGKDILLLAAEAARNLRGETVPLDALAGGEGRWGFAVREPLGVAAAISPFNAPINLSLQKVAPAIAAGCTVVLKPAEQTPLTVLALGELFQLAGLPDGALSILPGTAVAGRALVTDPRVAIVSFTGSAAIGEQIKSIAGLKRVVLELGANSPNIVCADADLDLAADALAQAGFASSGQICVSAQRIFVQEPVYEQFVERLVAAAGRLKVGDPLDESTRIGPIIDERSLARIESMVAEAVTAGARVRCGGRRQGPSYLPTVLEAVSPNLRVQCEEIFGPVVTVTPFTTAEEAIAAANDSPYGLQAGVFTRDISLALKFARDLYCGSIWINDSSRYRQDNMPFGGVKHSGIGKEGIPYAVEEFTYTKFVGVRL